MNSAEVYRKLFAAFVSGARDEFFKVAEEIIEEEENKHNNKLAKWKGSIHRSPFHLTNKGSIHRKVF